MFQISDYDIQANYGNTNLIFSRNIHKILKPLGLFEEGLFHIYDHFKI